MALTHRGSITLGACVPIAATAQANLDAAIGVSLPQLQAQLAGALEAQARLTVTPPSLSASLDAALDLVANIQAHIALGLPGVSLSLTALAAVVASIQAQLGSLQASATFSANLAVLLGTPGVHAYTYSGEVGDLGDEVKSALSGGLPSGGGPTVSTPGVLFLASTGAAADAMGQVLIA